MRKADSLIKTILIEKGFSSEQIFFLMNDSTVTVSEEDMLDYFMYQYRLNMAGTLERRIKTLTKWTNEWSAWERA